MLVAMTSLVSRDSTAWRHQATLRTTGALRYLAQRPNNPWTARYSMNCTVLSSHIIFVMDSLRISVIGHGRLGVLWSQLPQAWLSRD